MAHCVSKQFYRYHTNVQLNVAIMNAFGHVLIVRHNLIGFTNFFDQFTLLSYILLAVRFKKLVMIRLLKKVFLFNERKIVIFF